MANMALIYVDGNLFDVPKGTILKSDNIKLTSAKKAFDLAQQCADIFNHLERITSDEYGEDSKDK